jgi:hypothetical protein
MFRRADLARSSKPRMWKDMLVTAAKGKESYGANTKWPTLLIVANWPTAGLARGGIARTPLGHAVVARAGAAVGLAVRICAIATLGHRTDRVRIGLLNAAGALRILAWWAFRERQPRRRYTARRCGRRVRRLRSDRRGRTNRDRHDRRDESRTEQHAVHTFHSTRSCLVKCSIRRWGA